MWNKNKILEYDIQVKFKVKLACIFSYRDMNLWRLKLLNSEEVQLQMMTI